jgi:hypothetical protein
MEGVTLQSAGQQTGLLKFATKQLFINKLAEACGIESLRRIDNT